MLRWCKSATLDAREGPVYVGELDDDSCGGGGGGLQRRSIARRPMPNVENGAAVRRSDGIGGQHHDPSGRRIFSLTNPNIQTWWSPERGTDRWWCDAARGRVSTPRPSGSHGWIDYCSTLVLSACRKRMHPQARREWYIGINKIPRSVGWHDCGGIVLMLRKFFTSLLAARDVHDHHLELR
jgi:hypothetical protein